MAGSTKPARQDRSLLVLLLLVALLLALGFVAAWSYRQHVEDQRISSSFTTLRRVAVGHSGYSMAASFAIKTSEADARWARNNRPGIEAVVQEALSGVDPVRALAPGGLLALQRNMHAALNKSLSTDKIQEVVITDFLVSEGDF